MKLNIAIVGGLGFIGTNFRHQLQNYTKNIKDDIDVSILDKNSYCSINKSINNSTCLNYNENIHIVDASSKERLFSTLDWVKPDIIINFAAQSHVDNSIKDPLQCITDNYTVVGNILEFIKTNSCGFIQISTDEVFGPTYNTPHCIDEVVANRMLLPSSPYSATKAAAELLIRSYYITFGIHSVIVRFTNLFGKYQHIEKFIPKYIDCLNNKKLYPLYGDGNIFRSWNSVDVACNQLIDYIFNSFNPRFKFTHDDFNILSNDKFYMSNMDMMKYIYDIYVDNTPNYDVKFDDTYSMVEDRLGHDRSYYLCDNYNDNFNLLQNKLKETVKFFKK